MDPVTLNALITAGALVVGFLIRHLVPAAPSPAPAPVPTPGPGPSPTDPAHPFMQMLLQILAQLASQKLGGVPALGAVASVEKVVPVHADWLHQMLAQGALARPFSGPDAATGG